MAEQWIIDLTKEVQLPDTPPEHKPCTKSIYRVPKTLTDVNSEAYKPKLASFGPYHHDCSDLHPMEQHKHRALIQFLRRVAKSSKTPEDVVIAMRKEEPRLLASYDSLQINEDDDEGVERGRFPREWLQKRNEFLKLMIVDGCFALEVMLAEKRYFADEPSDYDRDDPIFGERRGFNSPDLKRDMLLLENQIPLLALTTLAAIDGSGIGDVRDLIKSFCNFFGNNYLMRTPNTSRDQTEHATHHKWRALIFWRRRQIITPTPDDLLQQSVHILDLYRRVLTAKGVYLPSYENVQSATTLRNAGISFCKSNTKTFGSISFNGDVLSLPPLDIDGNTEPLLLNLMAFERLHATAGNQVTAYAYFMDGLINSADDVALLRTEEIITGLGSSDEDIATMIENITSEAELVTFKDLEVDVNRNLNEYCKKKMHRWRASFVETYLGNPWVFTSLLGALFLLALTVVQTVYSMLQYYDSNNNNNNNNKALIPSYGVGYMNNLSVVTY